MTKIEIIEEMYNVVNNNADVFQYADKYMINVFYRDVRTTKKATLEQYLAKLNAMVEEAKKVENDTEDVAEAKATKNEIIEEIKNAITTNGGEVSNGDIDYYVDGEYVKVRTWRYKDVLNDKSDEELNHHLSIIKKGIKQKIIKGLHENGKVKCDIMTATALETEGFITMEDYYDSTLYGEINKSDILKEMFNDVEFYEMKYNADELWAADMDDIEIVTNLCDDGYLDELKYNGDGNWYCRVNWDNVIDDFCKRWDAFFKLEKDAA